MNNETDDPLLLVHTEEKEWYWLKVSGKLNKMSKKTCLFFFLKEGQNMDMSQ